MTVDEINLSVKLSLLNKLFCEIRDFKSAHPELKSGHYFEVGSILNAYREGDLTFDECKALLEVKDDYQTLSSMR